MRDTHEFIREVNGRQYNAQSSIYFLPAGESSNSLSYSGPPSYSQLSWMCDRPLHASWLRISFLPTTNDLSPLSLVQIKSSMVACGELKLWCLAFICNEIPLFSAKQHHRHCVVLGDQLNPHPTMVEIILQPEPGVEKKVLDVGQSPFVILRKPH